jgi:hypothetical protein
VTELLEYGPGGELLFRKVVKATGASKGSWYIGPNATVTADVSYACTDSASCGASALASYPTTVKAGVHVLLGGTRAATIRPPQPAGTASAYADVLYYHRDQQGSVVATSLRSGGVDGLAGAKYRYTPWGQLDKVSGVSAASDSELGYTGGLRLGYVPGEVATLTVPQPRGLLLLGARVYHAELKRWLQPDTVDGRRFTYTGGDPRNYTDPSGRMQMKVPVMMAEMYYRTFIGDPSSLGSWNLYVGGMAFDSSVGDTVLGIGLRDPLEERNGTNWITCPFDARQTCSTLTAQLALPGITTSDAVADTGSIYESMDVQTVYTGKPWYALKQQSWEDQLWVAAMSAQPYLQGRPLASGWGALSAAGGTAMTAARMNHTGSWKGSAGAGAAATVTWLRLTWAVFPEVGATWAGISGILVSGSAAAAPIVGALGLGWGMGREVDAFYSRPAGPEQYGQVWVNCP